MENEYNSKQEQDSYQPRPSPELIARAKERLNDPDAKWIPLEEFLKMTESPE
jgi:hypothetical protein